jgi:hypothetical protein
MATYRITTPDGAAYNVTAPDSATPDQVVAFAQQQHQAVVNQIASDPISQGAQNFASDMPFMDKFNAGVGKAVSDIGTGIGQRLGLVSRGDVAESRKLDAPLMKTGAGVTGNIAGNVTLLAPTSLATGGASLPAAAAVGGTIGYLQPSASAKEDVMNTVLGAAGAAGGQYVANKAAGSVAFQRAQNAAQATGSAQKTAAATAASDAGYVIPPEDVGQGGGLVTKLLSGVGGKVKTAQVASERNQGVTNDLIRKTLGLAPDEPLTVPALNAIREQAGQAYDAVKGSGVVTPGPEYAKALDDIAGKFTGAAQAFPGAVKTDIPDIISSLKQPSFPADAAVDMTKILRAGADSAFAAGDKSKATALRSASNALENALEAHLSAAGNPDALQAFRDARQLIAQTYSIQKGLNPTTGDVAAGALAKQLDKGKPLSGNLLTVAQTAQAFPKATQALKEAPKTISPLDVAFALSHAAGGKVGNLLTLGARPAARSILLSNPMQKAALESAATPQDANAILRLLSNDNLTQPIGIAGGNALSRYLVNQ